MSNSAIRLYTAYRDSNTRDQWQELFVNNNFFKLIKNLTIKEMIVENEKACAVVSHDLMSLKGKPYSSIVAEIWKMKEGKLDSLAIYFDEAAFRQAMT